jgi:hypothetical protein
MAPLHPLGSIHCTNPASPSTSRCVVLARGYQSRDQHDLPEREVYAIVPLAAGTARVRSAAAAAAAAERDVREKGNEPLVVDAGGVIHVVLRSAVLPLPSWGVGEKVVVEGAGVEVVVPVKRRRYKGNEEWEYVLFEDGEWDSEVGLKETFDVVRSLDFPEPSGEELDGEGQNGMDRSEVMMDGDDGDGEGKEVSAFSDSE